MQLHDYAYLHNRYPEHLELRPCLCDDEGEISLTFLIRAFTGKNLYLS